MSLLTVWLFLCRHAELILERGIALIQTHPSYLKGKSKYTKPISMPPIQLCLSCTLDFYIVEECFFAACELQQLDWAQFFLSMVRLEHP